MWLSNILLTGARYLGKVYCEPQEPTNSNDYELVASWLTGFFDAMPRAQNIVSLIQSRKRRKSLEGPMLDEDNPRFLRRYCTTEWM